MTRKSVSLTISKAPTLSSLGTWPWGMVLWTHTHPTREAIFPGRTESSSAGKSRRHEGQALPCPPLRTGVVGSRRILIGELKELPTCLGCKEPEGIAGECEETLLLSLKNKHACCWSYRVESRRRCSWPWEGHSTLTRLQRTQMFTFGLPSLFVDKQTEIHYASL